ncbi:MAG: hypothetical protein HN995_07195 [Candidatus Marinimicrobia bacterium]|jgi:hypothetical protein|nr:hypothetical protein [Candidatus Neomarinimicrobiota bacterium]MBT3681012.1 hypothetical protein [Candidatus Neomarinimicrobiota bacterium]MBT3952145.1 hypothetical protein [Candidatus Neomarinimicrobiota bacterium]MBT4254343.1 hypothetical protein [Candidatus Neomarinimicrobiota bacterium]MBT4479524.1 hypothetical protein [Candidatus Neomarinimicrobiota bacterium]
MIKKLLIIAIFMAVNPAAIPEAAAQTTIPLNSLDQVELVNVDAEILTYKSKTALQVKAASGAEKLETLVLIPEISFKNGVIEIEVSGEPAPGAIAQARGFVGLAFRVHKGDDYEYDCFYLRPTNARAENQIQRNHSLQYISHPEFPWYRLRKETPEKYESYVDMLPGEWIKLKIEVSGATAKFYVAGATQPNLIVNDLKRGASEGGIALWMHSSTLAHYRNLVVYPEP